MKRCLWVSTFLLVGNRLGKLVSCKQRLTFFGKRMIEREELSTQKAKPKATVNNSQAVAPSPNQGPGNVCPAGFQKCYAPENTACLRFSSS